MAVITKKDEKVAQVVANAGTDIEAPKFIEAFKEMFPKDWKKICENYREHVQNAKPGKKIPMPNPEQYLINALKVWRAKNQTKPRLTR